LLQPINNARTLSEPRFQHLDIWLSGPGFQDLNARFQDLDLRTWVSRPQREVSGPDSQNLSFRPSVFGSQDLKLSGPGFQDLENSPSYGRLIFFPSLFSESTVTFLFPVTFLCVQWSQTEEEEEESERRTGLCILIHRQDRFCHRKCRPLLGGWKNFKEPPGSRQLEVDIWFFSKPV